MFTGRQRGNSREAQASFTASVAKDLSDLDTAGGKHTDIVLYCDIHVHGRNLFFAIYYHEF